MHGAESKLMAGISEPSGVVVTLEVWMDGRTGIGAANGRLRRWKMDWNKCRCWIGGARVLIRGSPSAASPSYCSRSAGESTDGFDTEL